jgi:hypothetical protein
LDKLPGRGRRRDLLPTVGTNECFPIPPKHDRKEFSTAEPYQHPAAIPRWNETGRKADHGDHIKADRRGDALSALDYIKVITCGILVVYTFLLSST